MAFDFDVNIIRTLDNLIIVEAQDGKTLFFQKCIPRSVMRPAGERFMAVAIDFNDHSGGKPGKVGDVGTNWSFTPEPRTVRAKIAQHVPHGLFSVGAFTAKCFCP